MQAQSNQIQEWAGNSYELVIMTLNSGVFENERGTLSALLSLLTKKVLFDALRQQP